MGNGHFKNKMFKKIFGGFCGLFKCEIFLNFIPEGTNGHFLVKKFKLFLKTLLSKYQIYFFAKISFRHGSAAGGRVCGLWPEQRCATCDYPPHSFVARWRHIHPVPGADEGSGVSAGEI